jgi:hypothetical protein
MSFKSRPSHLPASEILRLPQQKLNEQVQSLAILQKDIKELELVIENQEKTIAEQQVTIEQLQEIIEQQQGIAEEQQENVEPPEQP